MAEPVSTLEHEVGARNLTDAEMQRWCDYFEDRIAKERGFQRDVLAHVVAELENRAERAIEKAVERLRAAAAPRDGRSLFVRGTYDGDANYAALDVVALNGASFIAKRDNPGPCPGDGWQLVAAQGKRGIAGPKGEPGANGKDAPTIAGWGIDRKAYVLVPIMADGTYGPALELRELFEQFVLETN
jgi:hypothetical protein